MSTLLLDYKDGEEIGLYVLIKAADVRVARNGKPFIAFRFQDRSGALDGMYWSASEEEIERYEVGKVAFLKGKRDTYQGTPQVKIEALRLAEAGEPNDPSLYVERIAIRREDLEEELDRAFLKITDDKIARIVRGIYKRIGDKFFTYPAAKRNHHAVAGGLAYHTLSMVKIAVSLIEIYPQLNQSLLIGGILLHDLGKTIELSGPISTEYTLQGQLLGHIVIINEMIDEVSREYQFDPNNESILLLKHIILAHHGKLEYGSPVVPHLLEAELMHYIDDMDAKINMISGALEKTEPGSFSQQIYPLERRAFYKPNI